MIERSAYIGVISGPPPLDEEKIKEIPETEITQEQVDIKLQCSVCWEDFQVKETVRQLPCQVSEMLKCFQMKDLYENFRIDFSTFIIQTAFYRGSSCTGHVPFVGNL